MSPFIVVGLGNPGRAYEATRHNVGFFVVEALCGKYRIPLRPGSGEYLKAELRIGGRRVLLVEPTAYMNNSGLAVAEVVDQYQAALQELLVVYDDVDLPLGTIRVRTQGSDGGHNGMRSIIDNLNSIEFPRIRCGIRKEVMPEKGLMADFVLSRFDSEEQALVEDMVERGAMAVETVIESGIVHAMTRFNAPPPLMADGE